jgi:hypothetical protein
MARAGAPMKSFSILPDGRFPRITGREVGLIGVPKPQVAGTTRIDDVVLDATP